MLGNIAGGSIHEVNFLFTHEKIIGQVLQLLDSDVSSVRIEITELIVNLTHSGKPEMIY